MKLLDRFGVKYRAVEEHCCGGLPAQMGLDYNASKAIEGIISADVDKVVTTCPLCLRTLQRALPDHRVRHVLSVVSDKINPELKPLAGKKAAYHDPCLLGRASGFYDIPRQIIAGLGAQLVRLPREREEAPCCGAGGAVPDVDQKLADDIARERIEEVLAAGVTTLLTSCDLCAKQLKRAVRDDESLEILTITEALIT